MYLLFGQVLENLYVDKDGRKQKLTMITQRLPNWPTSCSRLLTSPSESATISPRNWSITAAPGTQACGSSFPEAQRIYKADTGQVLPLTETQFKDALNATT